MEGECLFQLYREMWDINPLFNIFYRAIEVPLSLLLQHCRKLSVDSVVGSHPLIIQTEFDLNVLELAVEFMVAGRFHAVITTDNWVNLVHFSSKYGYRELFVTAFAYQNLEGHSNGVIANNIFDVPSLYDVARDAHRTHLQSWSNGDCIPFCLKPTRVSWVSTDLLKTELAVYFSKNTFAMINSYEDPKSTELMLEFFNSRNIENITDTKLMEGLMTAAVHFEHEELYLKSYFNLINLGCDWSKFPKIFYHQLAPDEALKCLRDGSSVFVTLVGEDGSKLKGHKETLARRLRFIFDLLHTFTDTIEIPFPVPCANYDVLQRFIEFSSTDSFPYSDGKGWFQRVTLLLDSVYFADFILYDELLKRALRHLSDFLNHHNAEKIYECLPIANSSLTVLEFMNKIQQKFLGQVYKSNTFLLREPENFIFALGQCQDSLLRDRVYDHWTDHNREALMTRRFTVKSVFRDPYFKGVNISHLLNYLESRKTRFGNLEQLVRCLMPIESSDNQLKRVEFSSAVNLREIPGLSITLCARSYDHNSANFLNFNCYDNQFKLSRRICQRYESRDCVNIPPKGYWKEGTMMVILRFPSFYKICGQSCEESMDSYTNGHSEKRFVFWPFCGQVIACVRTENGDNNIFLLDIPSSKWRNVSREIYPQPLKGQSLVVNDRLYFLNAGDWIVYFSKTEFDATYQVNVIESISPDINIDDKIGVHVTEDQIYIFLPTTAIILDSSNFQLVGSLDYPTFPNVNRYVQAVPFGNNMLLVYHDSEEHYIVVMVLNINTWALQKAFECWDLHTGNFMQLIPFEYL